MENNQTPLSTVGNWVKTSLLLKLFIIGILILVLLIPSGMLEGLITERQTIRDGAVHEITNKWGGAQTIGGPVITIPYTYTTVNSDKTTFKETRYAHFLPDVLSISTKITPDKRHRGIYIAVLYNAKMQIKGKFSKLDFDKLNIDKASLQISKAFVSIGIPDLKGVKDEIKLNINGQSLEMNPGIESADIYSSGLSAPITITDGEMEFATQINLNGSTALNFLPFGKKTVVDLSGHWDTPSFVGSFSPDEKEITAKNFSAHWQTLYLNRNYPQQGLGSFINPKVPNAAEVAIREFSPSVEDNVMDSYSSFGVKLLLPVDEYQKTMRSAKYNIMFIILTFVAFFFVEILNKRKLHPIQYLLVGFAICLFYVLLLSISEHLSFNWAYLVACLCIMGVLYGYTRAVFQNKKYTLIFNAVLMLFFGFFYSLLQLESYALLFGSLGLLIILASVMYLTRHLDWYKPFGTDNV